MFFFSFFFFFSGLGLERLPGSPSINYLYAKENKKIKYVLYLMLKFSLFYSTLLLANFGRAISLKISVYRFMSLECPLICHSFVLERKEKNILESHAMSWVFKF